MSDANSSFLPDLNSLRLSQDFEEISGAKKVLITVPVRKPGKQSWFRVHLSEAMRLATAILEHQEENEVYLVDRPLWSELSQELKPVMIFTVIDRLANVSLWPIKLPGPDGRIDQWNQSALQIANMAKTMWVRLVSNRALGAYEPITSTAGWPEPDWPLIDFQELLRIGFNGRFINTLEHPVIKRLQGKS
jgi:hypothetical protein